MDFNNRGLVLLIIFSPNNISTYLAWKVYLNFGDAFVYVCLIDDQKSGKQNKNSSKNLPLKLLSFVFSAVVNLGGNILIRQFFARYKSELYSFRNKVSFSSTKAEFFSGDYANKVIINLSGAIFPKVMFDKGVQAYNFHGSILPSYRGGGALMWMLYYRDFDKMGVTFHRMTEKLDVGDIIAQEKLTINDIAHPMLFFLEFEKKIVEILRELLKNPEMLQNTVLHTDEMQSFFNARDLTPIKKFIATLNFYLQKFRYNQGNNSNM